MELKVLCRAMWMISEGKCLAAKIFPYSRPQGVNRFGSLLLGLDISSTATPEFHTISTREGSVSHEFHETWGNKRWWFRETPGGVCSSINTREGSNMTWHRHMIPPSTLLLFNMHVLKHFLTKSTFALLCYDAGTIRKQLTSLGHFTSQFKRWGESREPPNELITP